MQKWKQSIAKIVEVDKKKIKGQKVGQISTNRAMIKLNIVIK